MAKKVSITKLSNMLSVDRDEAFLKLLYNGFIYLNNPSDYIRKSDIIKAKLILKPDKFNKSNKLNYWLDKTGMKKEDFFRMCEQEFKIKLKRNIKKLPKKLVKKIKAKKNYSTSFYREKFVTIKKKKVELPNVNFSDIGKCKCDIRYLTEEDVLAVYEELVKDFKYSHDKISPPGIRDRKILSSAVFRQHTSIGKTLKYPTVESVASSLFFSLASKQAFFNGNKRTALVTLIVFLDRHNMLLDCSDDVLYGFTTRVATHSILSQNVVKSDDHEIYEICKWICNNSRNIDKNEKPMTFLKLKKILLNHGCEYDINKHNFIRVVPKKHWFKKDKKLYFSFNPCPDGQEINKLTISKLRKSLELTEEHLVDSKVFYTDVDAPTSFYINKYRTLLRRLSKT